MPSPLHRFSFDRLWQDLRFVQAPLLALGALWAVWHVPGRLGLLAQGVYLLYVVLDLLLTGEHGARLPLPVQRNAAIFRGLLRLYALLQLAAQASALVVAAQGGWVVALSLALALGLLAGSVGAAVAHELGHSPAKFDRLLAWLLMGAIGYPVFMVEHYRGHHPWAATWDDPGSAREGEGLWRFLLRAVGEGLISALSLERHRLTQRQQTWLDSPLVWALVALAMLGFALLVTTTWGALLFWILHCVLAVCLLEAIHYIEHYGLFRQGIDIVRAPFLANHAWNALPPMSAGLLFHQSRHSDHHLNPWKPCPLLEQVRAPRLPTGYPGSVLLALFPPLWFAVMHPRLVEMQRQALAFESEAGDA